MMTQFSIFLSFKLILYLICIFFFDAIDKYDVNL